MKMETNHPLDRGLYPGRFSWGRAHGGLKEPLTQKRGGRMGKGRAPDNIPSRPLMGHRGGRRETRAAGEGNVRTGRGIFLAFAATAYSGPTLIRE